MAFLFWENKAEAQESLTNINIMYGCPYEDNNGYVMKEWDVMIESDVGGEWGFFGPENRLGMSEDQLMGELVGEHEAVQGRPEEFFPENESDY